MTTTVKAICFISILFCFISCQERTTGKVATTTTKNKSLLEASMPEKQGMDSNVLIEMLKHIKKENININSIVIARNGKTVLDAHFYPNKKNYLHDVASVTKSITSIITGIAIDKGFIKNENQKVSDFFPENLDLFDSDWKKELTIKHLLTMTSGLCSDFGDGERQLDEMRLVKNSLEYILNQKIVAEPGSEFAYCSCATQLLSAIIQKATNEKMEQFGRHLFQPLNIKEYIITSDKLGINNGWGDSYWLSSDLLKIGQLYLNGGEWNGKQIISKDWVLKSTIEQIKLQNGEESYGYKWWIPNELKSLYEGRGRGNQRLVVYPNENLVVIMTGTGFDPGEIGGFIIRSIKSSKGIELNQSAFDKLQSKLVEIQNPPPKNATVFISKKAKNIAGKNFKFEANAFGLTHFKLTTSTVENASLTLGLDISRSEEYGERIIPLGMDGQYEISTNTRFSTPMAARAEWLSENEILIDYNDFSSNHKYRINVTFDDQNVTWTMYDEAGFGETINLKAKY